MKSNWKIQYHFMIKNNTQLRTEEKSRSQKHVWEVNN